MKIIEGTRVSGGIAMALLRAYRPDEIDISKSEPAGALRMDRFEDAVDKLRDRLAILGDKARSETGEKGAAVFEAQKLLLEDARLYGACREQIEGGAGAEQAVSSVFDRAAEELGASGDPYICERSADVISLKDELLRILSGESLSDGLLEPCILVARDLSPARLMELDTSKLLGLVLFEGSPFGHTAILAGSLGIPALVRCGGIDDDTDGRYAVLDADGGRLYIDPDEEVKAAFSAKIAEAGERANEGTDPSKNDGSDRADPDDGAGCRVYANISDLRGAEAALETGAAGIGLFRSEFLYMGRDDEPTEEEQFKAYKTVLERFEGRPVIIRTCDLGADKCPSYLSMPGAENPALGLRGVRFGLKNKEFFKRQLRALLRASAFGNLGIMLPMVTRADEVIRCRELLSEAASELESEGADIGEYKLGVMIETPAAALCADELAHHADFFSIGTNDLIQYTCAADRTSPDAGEYFDPKSPAVLALMEMTVKAAHDHGITVGVCGEMAADLSCTKLLLEMGVDVLSVNPGAIGALRRRIRTD
ncbi:MAG: phosphoenolpyruvate--protein phosphotransferase [Lachnospiraceae bacterium]|nr:phosphoenolpyruvate--protein phosphotransferase [Lachnospiraceae bacterium]